MEVAWYTCTLLLCFFSLLFFMSVEILCVKYCSTYKNSARETKQYCIVLPCSGTVANRVLRKKKIGNIHPKAPH